MPFKTDLTVLERFISLPMPPEAAKFSTETVGSEDSVFFAELTFDQASFEPLLGSLAQAIPNDPEQVYSVTFPEWVTADGFASLEKADGTSHVKVRNTHDATPFLSSPYLEGFSMPSAEPRTLLVVLFTK